MQGTAEKGVLAGDQICLLVDPTWYQAGSRSKPQRALFSLDKGNLTALENWDEVSGICPAEGGFLITGSWKGVSGLYFLNRQGLARRLLSGGTWAGLYYDGTSAQIIVSGRGIFKATAGTLEQMEQPPAPLTQESFRSLVTAVWQSLPEEVTRAGGLSTLAACQALIRNANELARRRGLEPLPDSPPAFDELLERLSVEPALDEEGLQLLTANLVCLLTGTGSAEWLEGPEPVSSWQPLTVLDRQAFALGCLPLPVLRNVLYDSEGWGNPATSLLERAQGRKILLANSASLLEERVTRLFDPELLSVIREPDAAKTGKLLEKHPANEFLRRQVWAELLAGGHDTVFEKVMAGYLAHATPARCDLEVWWRYVYDRKKTDVPDAIGSLKDAIRRFPGEPLFYLVLGYAYTSAEMEDRIAKARQCFKKTAGLAYGELEDLAEQELAKLNQAEEAEETPE